MRLIYYIPILFLLTPLSAPKADEDRIWQVAEQRFISEQSLITRLATSKNILIGIRPDNPGHHHRAARIIEKLSQAGHKPVILVSSVERSKQNAFAIFRQRHDGTGKAYDATGLEMLLDWSRSGQPAWNIARPVFDLAMLQNLPLRAVNFSRHEIGQLHLNGLGGLPEDIKPELLSLLTREQKGHLLQNQTTPRITTEIRQEYCTLLPPEVLAKFTLIRRAQEGLFALEMVATGHRMAVLVTSQTHVTKDIGVPRLLKKMGDGGKNISLSFVETGQDVRNTDVDFIWTTAKFSRPRPCQAHLTN